MYCFTDKEGTEVTLRPEMTPSLARMVLGKAQSHVLPLKWYSVPQCWRFETTQRGRKREHYQWNMDVVGCAGITAEVELLKAITMFFSNIGITSKVRGAHHVAKRTRLRAHACVHARFFFLFLAGVHVFCFFKKSFNAGNA